jgi:hypothetical protein
VVLAFVVAEPLPELVMGEREVAIWPQMADAAPDVDVPIAVEDMHEREHKLVARKKSSGQDEVGCVVIRKIGAPLAPASECPRSLRLKLAPPGLADDLIRGVGAQDDDVLALVDVGDAAYSLEVNGKAGREWLARAGQPQPQPRQVELSAATAATGPRKRRRVSSAPASAATTSAPASAGAADAAPPTPAIDAPTSVLPLLPGERPLLVEAFLQVGYCRVARYCCWAVHGTAWWVMHGTASLCGYCLPPSWQRPFPFLQSHPEIPEDQRYGAYLNFVRGRLSMRAKCRPTRQLLCEALCRKWESVCLRGTPANTAERRQVRGSRRGLKDAGRRGRAWVARRGLAGWRGSCPLHCRYLGRPPAPALLAAALSAFLASARPTHPPTGTHSLAHSLACPCRCA